MARGTDRTRQRLLQAARAEFAAHGLAGARVDRIAASAGVNKERIYGHFGSKDALFDAVLSQAMLEAAADKPLQPGDTPADYAALTVDFHRTHPELVRLLLWEALSRAPEVVLDDPERRALYDRKIDAFTRAGFDDGQARFALFAVLALSTFARTMPQVTALVLGADHDEEDLLARIVAAVTALAEDARHSRPGC